MIQHSVKLYHPCDLKLSIHIRNHLDLLRVFFTEEKWPPALNRRPFKTDLNLLQHCLYCEHELYKEVRIISGNA